MSDDGSLGRTDQNQICRMIASLFRQAWLQYDSERAEYREGSRLYVQIQWDIVVQQSEEYHSWARINAETKL